MKISRQRLSAMVRSPHQFGMRDLTPKVCHIFQGHLYDNYNCQFVFVFVIIRLEREILVNMCLFGGVLLKILINFAF